MDKNKDILFSHWYDSLEGTKSQGFAYKAWCAGWDAAADKERKDCAEHYLGIMRSAVDEAVLKEREACARTCDNMAEGLVGQDFTGAWGAGYCAEAIRARRT